MVVNTVIGGHVFEEGEVDFPPLQQVAGAGLVKQMCDGFHLRR